MSIHDDIQDAKAEAFRYKKRASRLRKKVAELNQQLQTKDEVISQFARHKHNCHMGEYNTTLTGKGCTCGLSKTLKGQ